MKKKINKKILFIVIILSLSINFANFGRVINYDHNSSSIVSAIWVQNSFFCGIQYLPFTIDPQDCWDPYSLDIIIQVMETLFTYNYSDPTLPIIPLLATDFGTWDPSHTQYTIDLRTGVTFHDGSIFDADDVVFTFERQAWLYNFTGLNTGYVPDVYELYVFPNGTPIINDVIKIDADTIIFELDGVYEPFIDLLCYPASSILTDTYYNITGGIVELDGDIIGTGPFTFENYERKVEVNLSAYKNYWRKPAQIERLVFVEIRSSTNRCAALLSGDIQFLKDPLPEMVDLLKLIPGITVIDTGKNSGCISFLGINNILINRTWREAISYAFDYNYLINEIRDGNAVRMKSTVGVGIKYYNGSFPVPTTNYTKARTIMQSMGYGIGFDVNKDDEWIATAITSPFRSLNYSYDFGNDVREAIFIMLISNLAKIGIKVTDAGTTIWELHTIVNELEGHTRNELELLFLGWCPDYNDPNNFIMPLFTNRSIAYNAFQYNGYTEAIKAGRDPLVLNNNVQLLMEQALITPNGPARESMYDRIQELLIEDMPCCWAVVPQLVYAHHVELTGFQQNLFNRLYFYLCEWNFGYHIRPEEENFTLEIIVGSIFLITGGIIIGIVMHSWIKRRIVKF
ncbi:MAG: ABC transporter substrate-binding protein [Promethearchaeota archaeon]